MPLQRPVQTIDPKIFVVFDGQQSYCARDRLRQNSRMDEIAGTSIAANTLVKNVIEFDCGQGARPNCSFGSKQYVPEFEYNGKYGSSVTDRISAIETRFRAAKFETWEETVEFVRSSLGARRRGAFAILFRTFTGCALFTAVEVACWSRD